MIYIFRCNSRRLMGRKFIFEVEQKIMDEHKANCPICEQPAQRVFTTLRHSWPDEGYTPSGKRIVNQDLPHVPTGTRYYHGF